MIPKRLQPAALNISLFFIGLGALAWFLIRVIPKPSRASYPCQRAAFPIASTFVIWLSGSLVGMFAYHRLRQRLKHPLVLGTACGTALLAFTGWSMVLVSGNADAAPGEFKLVKELNPETEEHYSFKPTTPNTPIGTAHGIHPGRVVWAHDPKAAHWSGKMIEKSDQWWTDASTDQDRVDGMLSVAIRQVTGEASDAEAWTALFRHYQQEHGMAVQGHRPGEVVAVKINLNNSSATKEDNLIDASPHSVLAMVRQLVLQAKVPQQDIIVYDSRRYIPPSILTKVWSEFKDVRFLQEKPVADGQPKNPGYGDHHGLESAHWVEGMSYSAGTYDRAKQVAKQIVDATYLINLACLKTHSYPYTGVNESSNSGNTGLTLCGKNHFGSIKGTSELHPAINPDVDGKGQAYSPIVDLASSPNVGGKTILYVLDGLYCGRRWKSFPVHFPNPPFNNRVEPYENPEWPSCMLASQDAVAIDAVGLDILYSQSVNNLDGDGRRRIAVRNNADNYLKEMALADHAPSGTVYTQGGKRVASLGVFEHWDGDLTRRYSRNLDPAHGTGIELLYVPIAAQP